MRIRDPGRKKFGFGIRDKHPGSATLLFLLLMQVWDEAQYMELRGRPKEWSEAKV
jgi:hypothetical protein